MEGGRLHKAPKDIYAPIPASFEDVPLCGKRDFTDLINLRVLRWEDSLDEPSVITRVLRRRRREATDPGGRVTREAEGHRERFEGTMLLILKMDDVATGSLWKLEKARE